MGNSGKQETEEYFLNTKKTKGMKIDPLRRRQHLPAVFEKGAPAAEGREVARALHCDGFAKKTLHR